MFDYDALEECEDGAQPQQGALGQAGRPQARPTDEPDWEAPAPAGWWRVVNEKGCWTTCNITKEILEWLWKDEVVAGNLVIVVEEGFEVLIIRDDGGRGQNMLIRGPLHHLEGGQVSLGNFGVVLEKLPSPPPAEVRVAHRRVVEARRMRGRLARAGGRRSIEAAKAEEATVQTAQILPDVTSVSGMRGLIDQAKVLSGRSFPQRFDAQDFLGTQRLTLLVNPSRTTVVGYCFYLLPPDGYLWVEQIAVEERSRGKGLGKMLMRWSMEQADALACWAVRLSALKPAVPFYRSLGFSDFFDDADFADFERTADQERSEGQEETGWPMHVRLRQHPKPRGFRDKGFYPFQRHSV